IRAEQGRIAEARAAYGRALALRPDPLLALQRELLCSPVLASAAALDAYRAHAEAAIDALAGQTFTIVPERVQASRAEPPYDWAYHGRSNLDLKRKYAALFAPGFAASRLARPLERRPSATGPWRIGF